MLKINKDKLKSLQLNTKNFYVLADFDNTITAKECKSSMGILTNSEVFGDNFTKEHSEICNQYKVKALEAKDYATKNEMWNKTLRGFFELFQKYNLTENLLENIVEKSNIKFREGVLPFLKFLYQNHIPVIIISAGVRNCIEIFLKNHNAFYDNITILSNLIKFNSQGTIIEIPHFVINPANKNRITFSKDLQMKLENRDNILLLGDVPDDIRMIENKDKEKTLSIAFANRTEDIDDLKRNFDIVSENSEIFDILKEKIKKGS